MTVIHSLLALSVLAVSCGGTEFSGGSSDGGPDGRGGGPGAGGSSGGASGTATGGAAGSAGTGTGGGSGSGGSLLDAGPLRDAGPDPMACITMRAQVVQLQQAAQSCSPGVPGQCIDEAESFCCPIVVASKNSQATMMYLVALSNYLQKCGPEPCPDIPCLSGPGICTPVGSLGTCARSPMP
jgi:hypothetical protein